LPEFKMMTSPLSSSPTFQVRFASLFDTGRALAFPCDARGRVDLDALSEPLRDNYLYARAMVGRDYSMPLVCAPGPV
jgi:hypothetical protein